MPTPPNNGRLRGVMSAAGRQRPLVGLLVILLIFLVAYFVTSHPSASTPPATSSTSAHALGGEDRATDPTSGLPTIKESALPVQARSTLALIAKGGPYPYSQDGVVFDNREHVLPAEPSGYYHEYTVRTPGASDRGARRIIVAKPGQKYYTADHYDTFSLIVEGA